MENNQIYGILCIDDEPVILQSMKTQLKQHFGKKFRYEFAESGEEAFEILDEFNQNQISTVIIVSDWLMPKMKGDELLIKVHKKYPSIVTILLTGQADSEAVARAQKHAQLHKFLPKPWEENELVEAIDSGFKKFLSQNSTV